jgi:hypothetical protein
MCLQSASPRNCRQVKSAKNEGFFGSSNAEESFFESNCEEIPVGESW